MLQPFAGYVLDAIGLKRGYAIFAISWSFISMAHGLANSWQALAGLRALLGLAEGSANPAGMKATAEWFPARERGLAGGVFNIGASVGSMLAPPLVAWAILAHNWQFAFVITGALGLVWAALWLAFYSLAGNASAALRRGARVHPVRPGGASPRATARGRRSRRSSASATSGASACRAFLADPTWGTLTFWVPLYLTTVRHFDLKQIALFAWLPFLAADFGSMFGGFIVLQLERRGVTLLDARRWAFTVGAMLMLGMGFVGFVDSPYVAIALISLGGFAHQTLSVTVITMASDLFRKNEVATVAGMAGTLGNAGVLVSSLLDRLAGRDDRLHAVLHRPRPCSISSARRCCGPSFATPAPARRRMTIRQSDSPRLQSRSVDRARRRRLLHRDVDVRVVSRACRSTTRAISCIGVCSRGRSRARASSTCAAIPTRAASGRRVSRTPTGASGSSTRT